MINKPYKLLFALLLTAAFTACSEKEEITETQEKKSFAKSERPVYISPTLEDSYLLTAIKQAFPNQTSVDDAQIIFIGPETPNSEYYDRYLDGAFVMICGVDDDTEKKVVAEYSGLSSIPEYDNDQSTAGTDNLMLFGFNNRSDEFWMPWPFEPRMTESEMAPNDDPGSEQPVEGDPDYPEYEVEATPYTIPPYDSDYILDNMDELVAWADRGEFIIQDSEQATRADDAEDKDPLKLDYAGQHHHFIYPITVSKKIDQMIFSAADFLTCSSVIEGDIDITPLYASSATPQSNAGDYYVVRLSFTVKNGEMWKPRITTHGLFSNRIIGYYLKRMGLKATLLDSCGTPLPEVRFLSTGTPDPQSNMGSSDHEESVTKSIEVGITVGKESGGWKGEVSGSYNYSWSSSVSRSLQDLQVELNTPGNAVSYALNVHNIINEHNWDNVSKDIATHYPEICRSDMKFCCSWVWYLPAQSNGGAGVGDGSNAQFRMKLNMCPVYGVFSWWRGSLNDHEHNFAPNINSDIEIDDELDLSEIGLLLDDIEIPAPNRTRFGFIELKNMSTMYTLTDVRICESGSMVYQNIKGAVNKNKSIVITVPDGTYDIEYTFVDPNTNTKVDSYRITSVEVEQGSSKDDSTTEVASTQGVKF